MLGTRSHLASPPCEAPCTASATARKADTEPLPTGRSFNDHFRASLLPHFNTRSIKMYLERVTSDQKLSPCPCPSLPQPPHYPLKEKEVHLGLSYCTGKEIFTAITNSGSTQHFVEPGSSLYGKQNTREWHPVLCAVMPSSALQKYHCHYSF